MRITHFGSFFVAFALLGCNSGGADSHEETATTEEASTEEAAQTEEGTAAEANTEEVAADDGAIVGEHYRIVPELVSGDGETHLVAVIHVTSGFHANEEYPWTLAFAEGSPIVGGPSFPKAETSIFETELVRYEVPLAPGATGDVTANLRFGVCSGDVCENPREDIHWTVPE